MQRYLKRYLSLVDVLLIVVVPVPVRECLAANLTGKEVTYFRTSDEYPSYLHLLSPSDRAEVEKAQRNIEKYRKSNVTIAVVDEKGAPMKGAKITINHTDHNFLFGFNDREPFALGSASMMREAGLNAFVATAYWVDTQLGPEEFNWDSLERQRVDVIRSMGFKIKVHPLVYLSWNIPPFLKAANPAQLVNATQRFLGVLLQKIPNADIYELCNEDNIEDTRGGLPLPQHLSLLKQVGLMIRQVQRNATISANTFDPFEEFRGDSFERPRYRYPNLTPYDWYKLLISEGIDFDVIGIQYRPGCLWTPGAHNLVPSLTEVSKRFDAFAALGKRIHITEFAAPSIQLPKMERYGNLDWNEMVQAGYVEGFYTLMFSKQAVDAVNWWITDSSWPSQVEPNGARPFERGSSSLVPKPSYHVLKNLITNRWRTRGSGATDAEGKMSFSGFGGKYALTIAHDGLFKRVKIHVGDGISAFHRIVFDRNEVGKEMETEETKLQNEAQGVLRELDRICEWSDTISKAKSAKLVERVKSLLNLHNEKQYSQVIEVARALVENPLGMQLSGKLSDFEDFSPILTDRENDVTAESPPGTDLTTAYAFADSSNLYVGMRVVGNAPNRMAIFTVQIKVEYGVFHANMCGNGTLCAAFQQPRKEGDTVSSCPFALGEVVEMRIPLWLLRWPKTIYLEKIWIWDEGTRKDFDGYGGPQVKIPSYADFLSRTVTETKTLHYPSTTTHTGYTLIGGTIESLLPVALAMCVLVILGIVAYSKRGRRWQRRQGVRSAYSETPSQVTLL